MRKLLCFMALALASAFAQQDIVIQGAGSSPYTTIARNVNWVGSGPGAIANNYIFQPLDPNQGFCLFIRNNNTTVAHSLTVNVFQTGDTSLLAYAGITGQWFNVPAPTGPSFNAPANGVLGINYKTTASAAIAVVITGDIFRGGSPDTASIFAVQTNQSACGSLPTNAVQGPYAALTGVAPANQFPVLIGGLDTPANGAGTVRPIKVGNTGYGLFQEPGTEGAVYGNGPIAQNLYSSPAISTAWNTQANELFPIVPMARSAPCGAKLMPGYVETDILMENAVSGAGVCNQNPAFSVSASVTNPTAAEVILVDQAASVMSFSILYKYLLISCTATCEIQIHHVSSAGTCTSVTPVALNFYGSMRAGFGTGHTAGSACTVAPTLDAQSLFDVFVNANQPFSLDLKGLFVGVQSTFTAAGTAIEVVSAVTGTVNVTLMENEAAP